MSEHPHLKRAPISEAIIDLRVSVSDQMDIEKLRLVLGKLPDQYTQIEDAHAHQAEVQLSTDGENKFQGTSTHVGFRCSTVDRHNVVQLMLNGFTFSEFKPYSKWEDFSKKAMDLWRLYSKEMPHNIVTRLALRYINHMSLPFKPGQEIEDYLEAGPVIPETLPQVVAAWFDRTTIISSDGSALAHVTQEYQPSITDDPNRFLLDIDAFREIRHDMDEGDIMAILDDLHVFKNDIFFNYISDRAKDLFK